MFKFIPLVLVVLLSSNVLAQPSWLNSYEEAKTQAVKENKDVMLMLSKEDCDACWYMENIVFEDKKLKTLLLQNFVPVYIDVNEDEVPEEFSYIGTPTFYFTSSKGKKIGHQFNGAANVKDFTTRLEKILKEAN